MGSAGGGGLKSYRSHSYDHKRRDVTQEELDLMVEEIIRRGETEAAIGRAFVLLAPVALLVVLCVLLWLRSS